MKLLLEASVKLKSDERDVGESLLIKLFVII